MSAFQITDKWVGPDHPCLVIAEAGVNHNGDPEMAMKLVEVAAHAGADIVKFQAFKADRLASDQAPKAPYQEGPNPGGETQQELLKSLELAPETFQRLQASCRSRGILFMATPFDEESADMLDAMEVPAFKISSGDLTNLPFLRHVASKSRPMIVSTGMADMADVGDAHAAITGAGRISLALLHCVSAYPAAPEDVNLKAMATLRDAFSVPVGFSDHTLGHEVALAAVALGAAIVEKHFTMDRGLPGPDHQASMEPDEFKQMVGAIRNVEAAMGTGDKAPVSAEAEIAAVARKGLVAACDIAAGSRIEAGMVAIMRPATGLAPAFLDTVQGMTAAREIPKGAPITRSVLEESLPEEDPAA